VVARTDGRMQDLRGKKIAIPGRLTTAFLLLQLYGSEFRDNITVMPFNQIINAVKTGDADAGLIIHESRFTYQAAGLKKIIDLGEWWEETTGLPIPLGGIIARRKLGTEIIKKIDKYLRMSIEYAFSNRQEPQAYIKQHSQELNDEVIKKHIDLYVNHFSVDLGDDGMNAVRELFRQGEEKGLLEKSSLKLMEQPE
jgi:1,4-dihydroxy-6-naphthoate synthase